MLEQWIAALAQRRGRLIAEIDRLFDAEPEAIIHEIALLRLETIEAEVEKLLRTKPKDGLAGKLRTLKESERGDDRLAYVLYQQRVQERKS